MSEWNAINMIDGTLNEDLRVWSSDLIKTSKSVERIFLKGVSIKKGAKHIMSYRYGLDSPYYWKCIQENKTPLRNDTL